MGLATFFLASRKKPEKSRIYHYKDLLSPRGMFGVLTNARAWPRLAPGGFPSSRRERFMSQLKLFNAGSLRRFFVRGIFAILVLPLAFLVMGCTNPSAPDIVILNPGQEWVRDNIGTGIFRSQFFADHGEEVTITDTTFRASFVGGNIVHVELWNQTSGIIFIEIVDSYNWDSTPRSGFTGFWFGELDPLTAFNGSEAFNMAGNDFPTLQQARNVFIPGALDTFFGIRNSRFVRQL